MPFSLFICMLLLTVLQLQYCETRTTSRNEVADCKNQSYTRSYDKDIETAVKLYDGLQANRRFISNVCMHAACIKYCPVLLQHELSQ